MLRCRTAAIVSLSTCLCVTQVAWAQFGFSGRTNSLVSLARNEAVQKDLGVGGEIGGKLSELYDSYRNASDREFKAQGFDNDALRDLPALERAAEMRKVNEKSSEVNRSLTAKFLPKLEELLSSEQIARLKQIQLQASGIEVWLEPLLSKELDLSDAQQTQLSELRNETSRRQQQLDGDFQQRFARIREMNVERDAKALEVLNDGQKSKLAELKGKPFDVSQLSLRRRGNN
ncbi:MAG TPA: hypothetical protein VGI40_03365 [Pirellulaceae bacterium]|jgi:hypothetical protein